MFRVSKGLTWHKYDVLNLILTLTLILIGLAMHKYDVLPSQCSSLTPWQLAKGNGDEEE